MWREQLASVSPSTVRRLGRACCLRVLLPMAAWLAVYLLLVRQGSRVERTFRLSLAAGSVGELCDRLCDAQRVWGADVSVDGFTLPHSRAKGGAWKLDVSGGVPVDGLSLFSASIFVQLRQRRCDVLRDAVFCLSQSLLCLHSQANTTVQVPPGHDAGGNVTQLVTLSMPPALAWLAPERLLRAHETMLRLSLLA